MTGQAVGDGLGGQFTSDGDTKTDGFAAAVILRDGVPNSDNAASVGDDGRLAVEVGAPPADMPADNQALPTTIVIRALVQALSSPTQMSPVTMTGGALDVNIAGGGVTLPPDTVVSIPDGTEIVVTNTVAMAGVVATVTGVYNTADDVGGTALNSLVGFGAAASASARLATIDNSALRAPLADVEFTLGVFATDPTGTLDIYVVAQPDGTNWASGGSGRIPPGHNLVAVADVLEMDSQRVNVPNLPIPPCKFAFVVVNSTDQTFPSTGNTFKARRHG